MSKLLIATNNRGKLIEIQSLLKDLNLELLTPAKIGLNIEVEENGKNYRENATSKAFAFLNASGIPTLADDSGLEVDALDGGPGVNTALFYSGPAATNSERREYLLNKLQLHPRPWTARFRCVIAIATTSREVRFAEGVCAGELIPKVRGDNGLIYDPIFYLPELDRTMAELSLEEKNQLSHRAMAILAARPLLVALQG